MTLSPTEARVYRQLRCGKVTRYSRLYAVWGVTEPQESDKNTLRVTVCRLRAKLEDEGKTVLSVRGTGYMLTEAKA